MGGPGKARSAMNERAIGLLKEIEKNCLIILESWRLNDDRHLATRLGLENILILCKLVIEEIGKGSPGVLDSKPKDP